MKKKLSEIQPGERFAGYAGTVFQMIGRCIGGYFAVQNVVTILIISLGECETEYEIIPPTPEPKYRPFKDAEEFEPHRDRWCKWKNDRTHLFRATSYHESVVWFGLATIGNRFDNAFTEFTFDDGSPFGVVE